MPDLSRLYKVGVVLSIDELPKKGGKPLRSCKVDVGDEIICVVTSAANVRDNSRIVVAPVGSSVLDGSGEEVEIKKTSVGGVMSEGMFCDSHMLGWKGGAQGVAATVPESFALGSQPPDEKPRPKGAGGNDGDGPPPADLPGLFEKKVKLSKEEKKKAAEERKARLKAKKAAKAAAPASDDTEEGSTG
mmetsp:Transcript_17282/g.49507  ORF Transcript_17282/g.49507 Transcript_17282/m.49507 type:complete len:188 (+) Transcript_17282:174-737(+)